MSAAPRDRRAGGHRVCPLVAIKSGPYPSRRVTGRRATALRGLRPADSVRLAVLRAQMGAGRISTDPGAKAAACALRTAFPVNVALTFWEPGGRTTSPSAAGLADSWASCPDGAERPAQGAPRRARCGSAAGHATRQTSRSGAPPGCWVTVRAAAAGASASGAGRTRRGGACYQVVTAEAACLMRAATAAGCDT